MSNIPARANLHTASLPEVSQDDITLLKRIKRCVNEGHDVEIKKAPDGKLKVLEVSKKNISVG